MNQPVNLSAALEKLIPAKAILQPTSSARQDATGAAHSEALPKQQIYGVTTLVPMRQTLDAEATEALYEQLRTRAISCAPEALADLGWMMVNGIHLQTNFVLGHQLLQHAADLRFAVALFTQAECFRHGVGFLKDCSKAEELYTSALFCGDTQIPPHNRSIHSMAVHALGQLYEEGSTDGEPDHETAVRQYMLAASLGSSNARIDECRLLLLKHSPAYDYEAALYRLQEAALLGIHAASHLLSEIYAGKFEEHTPPTDPDGRMRHFWYQLAQEQQPEP